MTRSRTRISEAWKVMSAARWIGVLITSLFVLASATSFSAQQQGPGGAVIRINVNLVQVDAVVTDSKGKPVTDLKAEDFEVLQDGKPQTITSFQFVDLKTAAAGRRGAPGPPVNQPRGGPAAPPLPQRQLQPQQIRRTIAIVVDDLALSFDSITHVRQSLNKWVDNEMQPGDLVAVIRTSAGMGSLQQFTRDKRVLHAAIELLRFRIGRVGASSFSPATALLPPGSIDATAFDQELAQRYSVGSMGAIQYVVQGLKDVPGRKSLILFSESLRLTFPDGRNQEVEDRLRRLTDAADRSSVVIYGVDPRGAADTGLTAEDNLGGRTPQQMSRIANQRSNQLFFSEEGLETLAQRTGGLFVHDGNDLSLSLREAVDDGNGYYLLGYHPDASTFESDNAKFHKISVHITRPGLTVRSRSGFFGSPDRGTPPPRTPIDQIKRALSAPFATGDLGVRLTALFSQSDKEGSSISGLLYINARDLTFVKETDQTRTAQIDIAAVTFDEEGTQIDGSNKTWRFHIDEKTYEEVVKTGMVYTIHVPIKKPGPYQLRVVLRDSNGRLGSATQFVEIPDVKKGRLALSGIVMAAEELHPSGAEALAEGATVGTDPNGTPAVRIFKQNTTIAYGYEIFNAHTDRNKKVQLEVQTRLFRDGQQIHDGTPSAVNTDGSTNTARLAEAGLMQLTQMAPGDYVLQVIVTDKLASEKNRIASQSMDFEVQ